MLLLQLPVLRRTYTVPFTTTFTLTQYSRCSSANGLHLKRDNGFGERTSTRAYPRTHLYQFVQTVIVLLLRVKAWTSNEISATHGKIFTRFFKGRANHHHRWPLDKNCLLGGERWGDSSHLFSSPQLPTETLLVTDSCSLLGLRLVQNICNAQESRRKPSR